MSRISEKTKEKIQSSILRILYDEAPQAVSATFIASEEARDKQFILKLLLAMEKKKIVKNVSPQFSRKKQWVMCESAYKKYKELL
tara:strand:+ start:189 stop:443 length:255 start_codon:yes stop_codon:yes gene_type:complete